MELKFIAVVLFKVFDTAWRFVDIVEFSASGFTSNTSKPNKLIGIFKNKAYLTRMFVGFLCHTL